MDTVSQEQKVHIAHNLNAGKEHRIGPYFLMGMILRINLCTNMMGVISTGITVNSQLGFRRKMPEGWKRGSNTPKTCRQVRVPEDTGVQGGGHVQV